MSTVTQTCGNCGPNGKAAVVTLSKPVIVVPEAAATGHPNSEVSTPAAVQIGNGNGTSASVAGTSPIVVEVNMSTKTVMEGAYLIVVMSLTVAAIVIW